MHFDYISANSVGTKVDKLLVACFCYQPQSGVVVFWWHQFFNRLQHRTWKT